MRQGWATNELFPKGGWQIPASSGIVQSWQQHAGFVPCKGCQVRCRTKEAYWEHEHTSRRVPSYQDVNLFREKRKKKKKLKKFSDISSYHKDISSRSYTSALLWAAAVWWRSLRRVIHVRKQVHETNNLLFHEDQKQHWQHLQNKASTRRMSLVGGKNEKARFEKVLFLSVFSMISIKSWELV